MFSSNFLSKTMPKFSSSLTRAAARTFGSSLVALKAGRTSSSVNSVPNLALNLSMSSDSSDFSASLAPPTPSPNP